MCIKRNSVVGLVMINDRPKHIRIDKCMRSFVNSLSWNGYKTVSCCCGHNNYPMTVVCETRNSGRYFDLISGKDVKRKKGGGWYKKDSEGYYYIPEVCKERISK